MKGMLLLMLRVTTGALLITWGTIKTNAPEAAISVSDRYYGGFLSTETIQTPLGLAQVLVGVLVVLGLLRRIVYPIQATILVIGALAIWKYLVDPLGLFLLTEETRKVLFFPSSTVAVASLILLAFKDYDTIVLDRLFKR